MCSGPHCLSCHIYHPAACPLSSCYKDCLVTTQTCLTQSCPGPLHLVVADQKFLCLDINKTCFFTFLKCCPLREAFCFHYFKLATLALTQPYSLSLSLSYFTFLHSTYQYLIYFIFYICTCSPSFSLA